MDEISPFFNLQMVEGDIFSALPKATQPSSLRQLLRLQVHAHQLMTLPFLKKNLVLIFVFFYFRRLVELHENNEKLQIYGSKNRHPKFGNVFFSFFKCSTYTTLNMVAVVPTVELHLNFMFSVLQLKKVFFPSRCACGSAILSQMMSTIVG